jgi:hypothetical protein
MAVARRESWVEYGARFEGCTRMFDGYACDAAARTTPLKKPPPDLTRFGNQSELHGLVGTIRDAQKAGA